jgi:GTP-binding protein YchF
MMRVGIIGLPNAGKSTLFNALTRAGAEAASYPFTTVDPNVAIVEVPDERLEALFELFKPRRKVAERIEFVDIAGLVRGAWQGEGLGNRFLGHIREVDAILHVVRAFEDANVAHPHGEVDPVADLEVVEAELMLADLESARSRLAKVEKAAKGGDRQAAAEAKLLRAAVAELEAGRRAPREIDLLTSKPLLVVANVGEGEDSPPSLAERNAVAICARDEAELAELDSDEAQSIRAELGIAGGALDRVIAAAYDLLGLITFFTVASDRKEVRAWSLPAGARAPEAAGKIHTDMQRGFVRAEAIAWDELLEAGSFAAAREQGKLRFEGKDYVVADGDVLTIRFASQAKHGQGTS